MEYIKIIWEWLSAIGGGVVSIGGLAWIVAKLFGRNLLDFWFQKRLKKHQKEIDKELEDHKSELDSKARKIQTSLDIYVEQYRIQYGTVFSERLSVFKEACLRLNRMGNFINRLASFNDYDCKANIDFNSICKGKATCDSECIIHYDAILTDFTKYSNNTFDFFLLNEMFFSVEQIKNYLKTLAEIRETINEAIKIQSDNSLTAQDKAEHCFKLFAQFDKIKLSRSNTELVDSFRKIFGINYIE